MVGDRYFSNMFSPVVTSLRLADGFVRNVLILMSVSTVALVIPLAATPVLTRLYTPAEFGDFALYFSVVSILSVLITGNYEHALMVTKKDEEAFSLIGVCVGISFLAGTALFIASSLLAQRTASLLGSPHVAVWLPTVPLLAFIVGLQQTFSNWTTRKRQFKRLGANKIVESVVTPATSVALGILSRGTGGLIVGLFCGRIAATWMLGRGVWQEKRKERLSFNGGSMVEQARRYSDFPLFSGPASLLDLLVLQIPILFLAKSFGPSVVGLFALSTRVLGAPLALGASCVGQVYYQWVAEARHRNEDLRLYALKVAAYLGLIVAGPVIVAVLFSPSVFSLVFGEEWRLAGEYARIIVFPLAARFIVAPLGVIIPASGNVRLGSVWKVVSFCATGLTLYIASQFHPNTFLYVYAANEVVLSGISLLVILKAASDVRTEEGR
jgi:O-antigen/teichoic acid export membrane protein